jgi:glutaredoxin-related protein
MISQKAIPLTIVLMFVFVFFNLKTKEPYSKIPSLRENIKYILYYSDDCSFSRNTLIYLQQNNIINNQPLILKEIYYNQKNLEEFYSLQEFCPKIEKKEKVDDIALPVLFMTAEQKCLFGNDVINQYFDKMLQ